MSGGFTSATVLAQYEDAGDLSATGEVEFTLEEAMSNGGVTMTAGTSVVAQLDASGNISQELVSNIDENTEPQGVVWRVDERINGVPWRSGFISVPSGGVEVDLGYLLRSPPFEVG